MIDTKCGYSGDCWCGDDVGAVVGTAYSNFEYRGIDLALRIRREFPIACKEKASLSSAGRHGMRLK